MCVLILVTQCDGEVAFAAKAPTLENSQHPSLFSPTTFCPTSLPRPAVGAGRRLQLSRASRGTRGEGQRHISACSSPGMGAARPPPVSPGAEQTKATPIDHLVEANRSPPQQPLTQGTAPSQLPVPREPRPRESHHL